MKRAASPLRRHLRAAVREQERRLRNGLAMRRDRAWWDGHDYDAPEWVASPRRRFHHGLRKTIEKLRRARMFLAEFDALRSA